MQLKLDDENTEPKGCKDYVLRLEQAERAESGQVEYLYLAPSTGMGRVGPDPPALVDYGTNLLEATDRTESLHAEIPSPSGNAEELLAAATVAEAAAVVRIAAPPNGGDRPRHSGFTIGHYLVERAIGRGGMGDVYLARDTRLGRPVAVKLLRADHQPTEDRVKRFQQEALAVCSLNHPNIVTIYEVGEGESGPFIVSEFIEGETLRRLVPKTGMKPESALEIAMQIAHALAASHQMGIVHRDIKPENVMVRGDGYVKVLDFGLAKLSDALEDRLQEQTGSLQNATPGVVMGTINYMSPEQARGLKVDGRTDVFSLGIVLYELVTGKKPFDGVAATDVLAAVLGAEPAPLTSFKPELSIGLQQVINKALRKDRDERYASMAEMIRDMRELKDELALQSRQESRSPRNTPSLEPQVISLESRSGRSGSDSGSARPRRSDPVPVQRRDSKQDPIRETKEHLPPRQVETDVKPPGDKLPEKRENTPETQALVVRTKQTARPPMPAAGAATASKTTAYFASALKPPKKKPKRRKIPKALIWLIAGVALIAAVDLIRKLTIKPPLSFDRIQPRKFTTTGQAGAAAISPDGRYVAFSQIETGGKESLLLRQVDTASAALIVPPRDVNYPHLTFSRDGNHLFFLSKERTTSSPATLYRMAMPGGALQQLPIAIGGAFDVSADGQRIAHIATLEGGGTALMVADLNTGQQRKVASRKSPDEFTGGGLAWSPNGETIACAVTNAATNTGEAREEYQSIVAVNLNDGRERALGQRQWGRVGKLAWLPDGNGLLAIAHAANESRGQLWHIDAAGQARRVTNDLNHYTGLSISADGGAIAAIQIEDSSNLWVAPANDLARARAVTHGTARYYTPSWTPDGSLIADSETDGAREIQRLSPDGSQTSQLTTRGQDNFNPLVTPDGRHLIVQRANNRRLNLWRMEMDESDPVQLTNGDTDNQPQLSPDGKWVFYESMTAGAGGRWAIWKVAVEGGAPMQVVGDARSNFNSPAVSPEGRWLAFRQSDAASNQARIVVTPVEGGAIKTMFDLPAAASGLIRWAYGGSGLTFVDDRAGASEIWFQPIEGGAPRQLTNFQTGKIFSYAWSNDGAQLAVTRGARVSDAVLITQGK